MKRRTVAIIIAASMLTPSALLVGIGIGNARSRWIRYTDRTGDVLIFRARCLASEDSAAHLRLRSFEDGRIVYGCFRGGY